MMSANTGDMGVADTAAAVGNGKGVVAAAGAVIGTASRSAVVRGSGDAAS